MDQRLVDRFEELLESDQNDPEIQYQIGLCYQRGEGVEQSGTEAEKWLRRAEAQGHQGAAALLAGPGGDRERLTGEITQDTLPDWCLQAERGDGEAQYKVGCYFLKEPDTQEEGERYLEKAVEQGSGQACLILGRRMLERGQAEEAVAMLRRAADSDGQPEAFFQLGRCYMEGTGVSQNTEIAERYMAQGAEAGGGEAMVEVAARYAVGKGLPHAPVKGLSWLKRAEKAGMKDAQARYDALCEQLGREEEERIQQAEREAQRAMEEIQQAREETARRAEAEQFRRTEDAKQAARDAERRAEALRRAEENALKEGRAQLEKQERQMWLRGQEGRVQLLLGLIGPVELLVVGIISSLLNLFQINGFSLPGVSKLILLPLLLLPFSVALLAGGLQKMQEAEEDTWYFNHSGKLAAWAGYWIIPIALEVFVMSGQVGNGFHLLIIIMRFLCAVFIWGVLLAFNDWLMGKLGITDCFSGKNKE